MWCRISGTNCEIMALKIQLSFSFARLYSNIKPICLGSGMAMWRRPNLVMRHPHHYCSLPTAPTNDSYPHMHMYGVCLLSVGTKITRSVYSDIRAISKCHQMVRNGFSLQHETTHEHYRQSFNRPHLPITPTTADSITLWPHNALQWSSLHAGYMPRALLVLDALLPCNE